MDSGSKRYLNQMEENKHILKSLVSDIGQDRMTVVFYDGMWTVKEHVKHLLMTQGLMKERIKLFIENESPQITPYYPENDAIDVSGEITDYIERFCAIRDEQIALVNSAGEHVFSRTGIHPGYVRYSFPILLRHIIMHDQFHFYRIEDIGLAVPENIERL